MSEKHRAPLTHCPHCGGSLGRLERPLTPPQAKVYRLIVEYLAAHGRTPTLRELADTLGLKSANSVYSHIRRLEAKGWLRRHAWKNRGIEPLVALDAAAGRAA